MNFKCTKCGFTHNDTGSFTVCKGCKKVFCCFCFKDSLEFCPSCFIKNEVKKISSKDNIKQLKSELELESKKEDTKTKKNKNKNGKKNIIYVRVSDERYKDNLKEQVDFIKKYAFDNYLDIDEIFEEIGYSISFEREKWLKILKSVENGEIQRIFILNKERFLRFGFEWYEEYCKKFGTSIIVVKNNKIIKKEDEIHDLMYFIYYYSYNIQGLVAYMEKMENDILNFEE